MERMSIHRHELFSVQCYSVRCTVYSVQCTVYSIQCTVYSVQCTVYTIHCIPLTALSGWLQIIVYYATSRLRCASDRQSDYITRQVAGKTLDTYLYLSLYSILEKHWREPYSVGPVWGAIPTL